MVPCNAVLKHSLKIFLGGIWCQGDALGVSQKLPADRKLLGRQLPALGVYLNLKSSGEIV